MQFWTAELKFYKWKFSFASIIWFVLALTAIIVQLAKGEGSINNFLIYKGVFWHTVHEQPLYLNYPLEYGDSNHYGPLFSLIILPFAILPTTIGVLLWGIVNAWILSYAINKLPLSFKNRNIILLISAVEMMTAMHNMQFNIMLTSWLIFAWLMVHKKNVFWATFFISLGILTKIYGIIGLSFFFFTNDKFKFIWSFILWMAILFALPMIISSPQFIIDSYYDWYQSIVGKNSENTESVMQNISVMRLVNATLKINLENIYFLIVAALAYLLPLLRIKQFKNKNFQLNYLAFLLIGIVIFSSSAESPTYIIAMTGVAIWYSIQTKSLSALLLVVFCLIFTSFSSTDIFPSFIKAEYIRPYAIKSLPCAIVWIVIFVQAMIKNFISNENNNYSYSSI
ncbi:MAG: glycosyltransferase family 87 protein [Ferruginibacter sp.]